MLWQQFVLTFVALFVALDIIGTLPIFLNLTHGLSQNKRNTIVDTSMVVALVVALPFVFIGDGIFNFFSITLPDFRIAGGLILLIIALTDLLGNHEARSRTSGSTGIVPLAVPLITGPGVIATLVLRVNTAGYGISILALLANYALAWLLLRHSQKLTRLIGNDGTAIISKLAALLLAAISVSMIRNGIIGVIESMRVPQ